ncbi:TraB/GumN family protein [Paenibacillus sp. 1001270B_150601_E10]|uniref:TraB/GumN family protein n=1 Tax=Paenibacillus sp. 1001270B_150601_E10 TaxID=2787079 RepID=UPI0018A11521|nr:TraB/GumN family protein [Paenibacillus sp. 1001270B_150601_E10]
MSVKKHWGRLGRLAAAGMLSFTLLIGNVFPVHAEAPAGTPAISPWSIETLNEGEKYGIYPLNWYYDGTFQGAITADKYQALMKATGEKLGRLGFSKKEAALSFTADKVITREAVITSLHKLLANYELPEAFGLQTKSAVDYMTDKGIVKGTKAGLELDKPITVEQAAVMASRVVAYAYDTAGAGAEGLMWKVTHGSNTLYLLGSIHLGTPEMYPMQKSIHEAFEASDDLWVEIDIVNGDMSYLTNQMVYSDGSTLKEHVAPETYAKLEKALEKLGIPADAFDGFKPFAITTSLSTLSYFDKPEDQVMATNTGIDSYFITKAMLAGKPIKELESIKLQADIFASVPADEQEKELNALLDAVLSGDMSAAKQLKQMQLDWIEGDAEGLVKTLTAEGDFTESETNQRLTGERDKNMAKKLAELLEQDGKHTSFVVVGSAHYVMKGMVVDLLKEKGYDVQYMN